MNKKKVKGKTRAPSKRAEADEGFIVLARLIAKRHIKRTCDTAHSGKCIVQEEE